MTPLPPDSEKEIRAHVFDGIAEYNQRLPNWWLMTLYLTIVFAVGYWAYYEWFRVGLTGPQRVERDMARIDAARLAAAPATDDASLWKMSRNPMFVEAGRATFNTTCASCHTEKLTGGIGPNLVDHLWIHGGKPGDVRTTVEKGVLVKGMPAWGPVIGPKKVTEVVAYILSYHQENEPVEVQTAWIPPLPK